LADNLFASGPDTVTDLHAGDLAPVLVYAGGDILDLHLGETLTFGTTTWYIAGESVRMLAGGNIVEPATSLPEQVNTVPSDGATSVPPSASNPTGIFASTSDLIYNANASDVSEVEAGGNIIFPSIAIAGRGQLWVQAGGNVYQADQGTIQSLGVNPKAPVGNGGASIAGVGAAGPDWNAFANLYLNSAHQASPGVPVGVGRGWSSRPMPTQLLAFLQQN
jgi:hypothetical protein